MDAIYPGEHNLETEEEEEEKMMALDDEEGNLIPPYDAIDGMTRTSRTEVMFSDEHFPDMMKSLANVPRDVDTLFIYSRELFPGDARKIGRAIQAHIPHLSEHIRTIELMIRCVHPNVDVNKEIPDLIGMFDEEFPSAFHIIDAGDPVMYALLGCLARNTTFYPPQNIWLGGAIQTQETVYALADFIRFGELEELSIGYGYFDSKLDWTPFRDAISKSKSLCRLQFPTHAHHHMFPLAFPKQLSTFGIDMKFKHIDVIDSCANLLRGGLQDDRSKLTAIALLSERSIPDDTRILDTFRSAPMERLRKFDSIGWNIGKSDPNLFVDIMSGPNVMRAIIVYISDVSEIPSISRILDAPYCNLKHLSVYVPLDATSDERMNFMRAVRKQTRIRTVEWIDSKFRTDERFENALASEWFPVVQAILSTRYAPRLAVGVAFIPEIPWGDYLTMIAGTIGWPIEDLNLSVTYDM